MERLKTNNLGQWQIEEADVKKATDEDRGAIEIKQRARGPKPKTLSERIKEIKQENVPAPEPTLNEQIEQKKQQYAAALRRSEQQDESLEKSRIIKPAPGSGFEMPKSPQVAAHTTEPPRASQWNEKTGKYSWRGHDMSEARTYGGWSAEGTGTAHVSSVEEAKAKKLPGHDAPDAGKPGSQLDRYLNGAGAHEVQHDVLGAMSQQLKLGGMHRHPKGQPTQRPLARWVLAAAELSPEEAHLLSAVSTHGVPGFTRTAFHEPHEAISDVVQLLSAGADNKAERFNRVKHLLPGETERGFDKRLKDIHKKIAGAIGSLKAGQRINVPNNPSLAFALHGTVDHKGFDPTAVKYQPHPEGLEKAWSVAAGLQPSSEQWEAAAAQMLGLPTDTATAEKLAKQAEERWANSLADSFKALSQPVEKTQQADFGRGPVDQNDESQLSEEERRIRAIKVDPKLLSD